MKEVTLEDRERDALNRLQEITYGEKVYPATASVQVEAVNSILYHIMRTRDSEVWSKEETP